MLAIPAIQQNFKLNLTKAGTPYKISHLNHPCSVWARKSYHNYWWLVLHLQGLLEQYTVRFQKNHFCENIAKEFDFLRHSLDFSGMFATDFAQAMPQQYKQKDPVSAYRSYYINEKSSFAKWNKGVEAPKWFKRVGK